MSHTHRRLVGSGLLLSGTRPEPVRAAKAAGLSFTCLSTSARTPRVTLDDADACVPLKGPPSENMPRAARKLHDKQRMRAVNLHAACTHVADGLGGRGVGLVVDEPDTALARAAVHLINVTLVPVSTQHSRQAQR